MDEIIRQIATELQHVPGFALARPLPSEADTTPASQVSIHDGRSVAGLIDHTLLAAEATPDQIARLCAEAKEYVFASVCVNPAYVPVCATLLSDSQVPVGTVIGFPLGATTTATKVFETRQALAGGAREVDMVIAIGRLRAGDYRYVLDEIAQVVETAHASAARCKVILETVLLNDEEKITACLLAASAQADFVKTSTGFSRGGATIEDVALMRRVVGPHMGVKASGGVRTLADLRAMVAAGATRIGASAGVQIVRETGGRTSDESAATRVY